jgi:hypothetical protein
VGGRERERERKRVGGRKRERERKRVGEREREKEREKRERESCRNCGRAKRSSFSQSVSMRDYYINYKVNKTKCFSPILFYFVCPKEN